MTRRPNRLETGPRKMWDGEPEHWDDGYIPIRWERFDYHEECEWLPIERLPEIDVDTLPRLKQSELKRLLIWCSNRINEANPT